MGWGIPPLKEISLGLSMFKFRRKWVTETTFWIKLFKSRKRKMKVRKKNELREQKKGRRETRGKQTRGLHKWLWEREKHEPGSETAQEAEEGGAGPLAPLASNSWVVLSMLWKDSWLAGGGGFSGILYPSLTCLRSTVRGPGEAISGLSLWVHPQ